MDNKQCIGLDKFYQSLSVIFPSASNDETEPSQLQAESRVSVKFTKNAIELLRESLTAFLRKVGRDLVEEIDQDELVSQQTIRPEDVAKILLAFDEEHNEHSTSASEQKDSTDASTNGISFPKMKDIVEQAEELLRQSKKLESQASKNGAAKRKHAEAERGDSTTIASKSASKQPKRKGKRKKQKLKITAEMIAEQERLLQASKVALESSQKTNGGTAASFRVELS